MEISIKKKKNTDNTFLIKGELTSGKLLAIMNALEKHNTPVAQDVLFFLRQASKDTNGKSILED